MSKSVLETLAVVFLLISLTVTLSSCIGPSVQAEIPVQYEHASDPSYIHGEHCMDRRVF